MAALARGLEVFAFVLGTVDFLEVDLGLGAASSMAKSTRGVLFFRSPSRLPSTASFVFAIAGRSRWTSDEDAESERWVNRGLQCMELVGWRKGEARCGARGLLFTFGFTGLNLHYEKGRMRLLEKERQTEESAKIMGRLS